MSPPEASARRETVGRLLLGLAAVAAALASIEALAGVPDAGPEQAMLVAWRALGLVVFAGLFAVLAWRPRGHAGVFELAVAHKAAMTIYAMTNASAADATSVVVADGLLTVALVTAYVLVRAHRAWVAPGEPAPAPVVGG